MSIETIGEHALSAFNVIAKFLEGSGKAADEAVNIKDAFANSKLSERMMQTRAVKNVRLATVLLSMLPNIVDVGGPPKPDTLQKGAQVMETLIYGAQRQRGADLQQTNNLPGQETHQEVLRKVGVSIAQLRAKDEYARDPIKKAAFEIVLSNVLEPKTSSVFKKMLESPAGLSEQDFDAWSQNQGVMTDFKQLYDSPVMNDPEQRTALIDAMHEMYATKEIAGLQALVGDTRLLFNYEVVFRAMNQEAYQREHPERIKLAAESLLQEGNLEEVVNILLKSNAHIFAERMVGFLAPYVPESQYLQSQAQSLSLTNDPGFKALNGIDTDTA